MLQFDLRELQRSDQMQISILGNTTIRPEMIIKLVMSASGRLDRDEIGGAHGLTGYRFLFAEDRVPFSADEHHGNDELSRHNNIIDSRTKPIRIPRPSSKIR